MAVAVHEDEVCLGELIRTHRVRIGLTQRELADFSTISVRAIRDLERGATLTPRRETIRLIADALRLDGSARGALLEAAGPGPTLTPAAGGASQAVTGFWPPTGELVGRDRPCELLRRALGPGGERLVGVTGMPGVGKTRLVMQVAAQAQHDGMLVLWHSLSRAGSAEWDVPPSSLNRLLTAAVNDLFSTTAPAARADVHRVHRLTGLVGVLPTLLVLDGVERPPAETTLVRLLRECPGLRVVYTSVRPLRMAGERLLPLAPLTPPAIEVERNEALVRQSSAVQLLLGWAGDGLAVDDADDAAAVAQICRRLDGLPLALRLAAPLLGLYGPQTLLRCLDDDLLGTLLAHHDPRRGVSLQRRLRGLLDDLGPREREVLGLMRCGDGSSTVEDVAAAGGLGLTSCAHSIDELLGRGLVRREGPGRFRVLSVVRELMS